MSQLSTYSREQRRALASASRDRLSFPEKLRPIVTLGGKEYGREDLLSCSYEGADGYAMLLDIAAKDKLSRDVEQSRVSVAFEVDTGTPDRSAGGHTPRGVPVRLPAFAGYALRRRNRGYAVTCATGGYEAERTPLGSGPLQDREWAGIRPDQALFDAMQPLRRRYAGIEIPPLPRPLLWRRGADRWTWNLYTKEPLDWAAEQAEMVIADTPTNTAFAYPARPLDRDAPPAWHFERGEDFDGPVGDETPDGERWARVIVHSQADDSGSVRRLASQDVDNRGLGVFGGSALMHALEPETDEDSAHVTAFNLARRLGRNDTSISLDLNYPPFFLRRGDVVTALDKSYEITSSRRGVLTGVLTTTSYVFRVESMSVDVLGMTGSVSGEGLLTAIERTEMSLPEFERRGGYRPLWGLFADGTPYVDDSLPWVVREGAEWFVDTEIAARYGVVLTEESGDYILSDGTA